MQNLLTLIKRAAVDAFNASNPLAIFTGTVESLNPLRVKVDDRLVLNNPHLVMSQKTAEIEEGSSVMVMRVQGGSKFVILDKVAGDISPPATNVLSNSHPSQTAPDAQASRAKAFAANLSEVNRQIAAFNLAPSFRDAPPAPPVPGYEEIHWYMRVRQGFTARRDEYIKDVRQAGVVSPLYIRIRLYIVAAVIKCTLTRYGVPIQPPKTVEYEFANQFVCDKGQHWMMVKDINRLFTKDFQSLLAVVDAGGGKEYYSSPSYIRKELAKQILALHNDDRKISLSSFTLERWGTAHSNIKDTAEGNQIESRYGDISLDTRMLEAVLSVYDRFGPIAVSSIAGGNHTGKAHHEGRAADINVIRGRRVEETRDNDLLRAVYDHIKSLGASLVLYPLNEPVGHRTHFHMEWARP
jgi:hypothetical protein